MENIEVKFLNWSECKIFSSPSIMNELNDVFSYFIPSAKYHPKFKAKKWDGKIRLVNMRTKTIPFGLIHRLKKYCKIKDYNFTCDFSLDALDFDIENAIEFIENLQMPFEVRDYQLEAFVHAVQKQRSILVSPTGSGKPQSFIY